MLRKVIVTTTIYNPTEAIEKFDHMKDWTLIVVGDLKTPKDFKLKNGIYISSQEQERRNKELSDLIGWNCIMRRNFGFLWAEDMGADIIASVDDDNIPYDGWGKNLILDKEVEVDCYEIDIECFDPVGVTNFSHLWHRGYPLQLLSKRNYSKKIKRKIKADIQADFWDGDPDIDAVCRFEYNPQCKFDSKFFPFTSNKISPFNSQNTFITKKALPHYFILPHVGRMDDIWASYHVQSLGFRVVYCAPSVEQKRNKQDLTKNLKDEFLGYEKSLSLVSAINAGIYKMEDFWPERTQKAYHVYKECF